jgi:hypothetical protein
VKMTRRCRHRRHRPPSPARENAPCLLARRTPRLRLIATSPIYATTFHPCNAPKDDKWPCVGYRPPLTLPPPRLTLPHRRSRRSAPAVCASQPSRCASRLCLTVYTATSRPKTFPRWARGPIWTSRRPTRSGQSRPRLRFRSMRAFAHLWVALSLDLGLACFPGSECDAGHTFAGLPWGSNSPP